MMHRPWSSIVEVPHCFSRSNVKFQGHTALKIVKFYRNWAFLDSNASLNSLMVMKCCTKLETAKERCPIVFQSHPSNFKVTRDKTSPLLTRIWRFRTIGRSQLSNPSDLPCSLLFGLNTCIGWEMPQLQCILGSRDGLEFPSFFKGHCHNLAQPCDGSQMSAVGVVQGDCERVCYTN